MQNILTLAKVPPELHAEALAALSKAESASKGLTKAKIKTRLLMAGKIAKVLPWDAERLRDVKPEWADHDVAPMRSITAQGDNPPWQETPEGGRPVENHWLNPDPATTREAPKRARHSTDAMAASTLLGGEHLAWRRGEPIDTANPVQEWVGTQGKLQVNVVRSGNAWIIKKRKRLISKLVLTGRYGFEADNVFCGPGRTQAWFPIEGVELRAPATWGQRLRWQK